MTQSREWSRKTIAPKSKGTSRPATKSEFDRALAQVERQHKMSRDIMKRMRKESSEVKTIYLGDKSHPQHKVPMKHHDEFNAKFPGSKVTKSGEHFSIKKIKDPIGTQKRVKIESTEDVSETTAWATRTGMWANKHKGGFRSRGEAEAHAAQMHNRVQRRQVRREGYKVGDTVTVSKGPHKGQPHKIIHAHDDGSFNVKPNSNKNKYRLGAARAKSDEISKINETLGAWDYGKPGDKTKKVKTKKLPDSPGMAYWKKAAKEKLAKSRTMKEAVKLGHKSGKYALHITDRDTSGPGKQDKFSMAIHNRDGKKIKDYGSHASLAGAKKFAKARGFVHEGTQIDEKINYKHGDQIKVGGTHVKISHAGIEKDHYGYSWKKKNGKTGYEETPMHDHKNKRSLHREIKSEIKYQNEGTQKIKEGVLGKQWQKGAKSVKKGNIELVRGGGGVGYVKKAGKKVGDFVIDDDGWMWIVNINGQRGQKIVDELDEIPPLFEGTQDPKLAAQLAARKAQRAKNKQRANVAAARKKAKAAKPVIKRAPRKVQSDIRDASDRNIIMQLRKAQDVGGNHEIEFRRGKGKLDKKHIDTILKVHDGLTKNDHKRLLRIKVHQNPENAKQIATNLHKKFGMKEETQIDEISKGLAQRYYDKSTRDQNVRTGEVDRHTKAVSSKFANRWMTKNSRKVHTRKAGEQQKKVDKRKEGRVRAVRRGADPLQSPPLKKNRNWD